MASRSWQWTKFSPQIMKTKLNLESNTFPISWKEPGWEMEKEQRTGWGSVLCACVRVGGGRNWHKGRYPLTNQSSGCDTNDFSFRWPRCFCDLCVPSPWQSHTWLFQQKSSWRHCRHKWEAFGGRPLTEQHRTQEGCCPLLVGSAAKRSWQEEKRFWEMGKIMGE